MKEQKKVNTHIIIMSVIGIIMSLAGLLTIGNPIAFFMLAYFIYVICISIKAR